MVEDEIDEHVYLGDKPLEFNTKHSSFYFDKCNRQIVISSGKEVNRVSLRRERDNVKISHIGLVFYFFFFFIYFLIFFCRLAFEINSRIIKFSLDHKFLAFLKTNQQIDFINLDSQVQLSQKCRRSTSQILDFFWISQEIFFFVTTNGFEIYQISTSSTRNSIKLVKEIKMPVKWFQYSSKLLVLGSGSTQSTVNTFFFKGSSLIRIPKFELDTSNPIASNRLIVKAKHITICRLYDRVYCIHYQTAKRQLHLYQMNKESVTRSIEIDTHTEGASRLHVIDNLLICHNIQKKLSLIFDIREEESFVAAPLPMNSIYFKNNNNNNDDEYKNNYDIDIYGDDWEYYQPNYIIIPSKGLLFEVKINLPSIIKSFSQKKLLIDFLLRRSNTKQLILEQLQILIDDKPSLSLLSRIFKQLNAVLQVNQEKYV